METTIDCTGYVRYTDVQFKWKNSVPKRTDGGHPLAALLSLPALVHPDHPLRLAEDDGIRLYIGVIKADSKTRLLFSTAQLQYIQYWLDQMGLTESPIPLPSSKYIVKSNELSSVEYRTYSNVKELKKADSKVRKASKHLVGLSERLKQSYTLFELGRSWWKGKGTWLAVDFEEWERDHTVLLEFGFCFLKMGGEKETGHVIVKDFEGYKNGRYVSNQRENFKFGESKHLTKVAVKQMIHDLITSSLQSGPLFLVFHDYHGDMKTLRSLDAPLDNIHYLGQEYPVSMPSKGIFVFDTGVLFNALEGAEGMRGLGVICRLLEVEVDEAGPLHNAGNDAYYTMMCAENMLSGESPSVQKVTRWPTSEYQREKENVRFKKRHVDEEWDGEDEDNQDDDEYEDEDEEDVKKEL